MPIFKRKFPGKSNKYVRMGRVILGGRWGPQNSENLVRNLRRKASNYRENDTDFDVEARDRARNELAELRSAARERSKKARKLIKLREKANAARKAGFTVKRKKSSQ